MSHDYMTSLLVEQRMTEFRHEAEQERLARLARAGRPRQQRWWERLMLFRTGTAATRGAADGATRGVAHRPAATVAASDSPC